MAMSRKDYQAAADILLTARNDVADTAGELLTVEWIAHRMADMFAADNPRFDRARFLSASGV